MGLDDVLIKNRENMIGTTASFLANEIKEIPQKGSTAVLIINHGYGGYANYVPEHVARVNAGRMSTSLMVSYLFNIAGYDTYLILSGGGNSPLAQSIGMTEAEYQLEAIKMAAENSRVINKIYDKLYYNIKLEKESGNTKENIIKSLEYLPRGIDTLVIIGVSDQQHGPRVIREVSNTVYNNLKEEYINVIPGTMTSMYPYDLETYLNFVHNGYKIPNNTPVILEGGNWLKLGRIVTSNYVQFRNMAKEKGLDVRTAEEAYINNLGSYLEQYSKMILSHLYNQS